MIALASDLAEYAWNAAENDPSPLSKGVGEYFARLPSAIARISHSLSPPTGVTANATGATSIQITWNAVAGATSYEVDRRSAGGGYAQIATPPNASFTDAVATNTAHLYRVRAVTPFGTSTNSAPDLATAIVFADDPLVTGTTPIRATHVSQLRTAVNAVRSLAGLTASSFTDPALSSSILVKRVHITELRSALDAARAALVLGALVYMDPSITVGTTPVRNAHVSELRNGLR